MQQAPLEKPTGNKPIAIEVDGEPLGVVIPEKTGFRFLAVRFNAFGIDGQVFNSVEAAKQAASLTVSRA